MLSIAREPAGVAVFPPETDELIAAWVQGWALSRGTERPTAIGSAHRIHVGRPGHLMRFVLPHCEPQVVQNLVAAIDIPDVWLKICADPDEVSPHLPPIWTIHPTEYLMRYGLQSLPVAVPTPYRLSTHYAGVVADVHIEMDGEQAAHGRVAVYHHYAIVDQVVTDPRHRRRGLARCVIQALSNAARELGASTGVLVATADGLALYQTLGWKRVSSVTPASTTTYA